MTGNNVSVCGVDFPRALRWFLDMARNTTGTATGDDGPANQIGMAPGAEWNRMP